MAKCIIKKLIDKCQNKNYHHGNLKEELLQEAIKIIQEDGVQALTLQILGTRLGTSRSAIYRHFSSKKELLGNVMVYGFELFNSSITPVSKIQDKTATEMIRNMGKEYLTFAIKNPNLFRMLFGEKYQSIREDNCDINDEEEASSYHSLIHLVIQAQKEGLFKEEDPILLTQSIHAMIHGLSVLYIDGHIEGNADIDTLFDVLCNTMISGLLK